MSKRNDSVIDETNLKILEILQEDCKVGVQKISEEVGKGISTVHARIKSLEQNKIIRQYSAILDPIQLNRPTLALIFVTIRYRVPGESDLLSQKEFCEEISKHPFVQEVFILSGEFDVFLKVGFLRGLPAVDKTLTMFVMDNFLETQEIRRLTQE